MSIVDGPAWEKDFPPQEPKKERSDGSSADYYKLPQGATQLQELISHKNMNAQIGEIFRACYRYGEVSHSDMLRDAKKMKFYAEAEIARLEKLAAVSPAVNPCQAHEFVTKSQKSCTYCSAKTGTLHERMCPVAIEARIRNNTTAGKTDYCQHCGYLSGAHCIGCPQVRTGQFCAECGLTDGHGHAQDCPTVRTGNKNCCAHGKLLTAPCPDCFDPAG